MGETYKLPIEDGILTQTTCSISPSDTSNWFLFGDKISKVTARNGILNIDATSGALEAVCDYEGFEDDIRVSADFRGSGAFNAGIELAVQPSGARYYAEIRGDAVSLYYIDEGENFTLLHSVGCTFAAGKSYSVWMHLTDGQLACGVGGETLIAMTETRVSGGYVGFYASSGIGAFSNISVTFNTENRHKAFVRYRKLCFFGQRQASYSEIFRICKTFF